MGKNIPETVKTFIQGFNQINCCYFDVNVIIIITKNLKYAHITFMLFTF